MWCNFYHPELWGVQPVRVFEPELVKEFGRIRSALHSWFPLKDLDKVVLDYKTGKHNLAGPFATSGRISLDETFLSAFWNYCFGLTLATPLGKTDKGDYSKYCNPYDSLDYCRRLFTGYEEWDMEKLPNPELRSKELIAISGGINRIYSIGLYFIIIHEFAHIVRGDIFQTNVSQSEYHEMEFSCDSYALEVFASSTDLKDPQIMIGLLCAVGLISFCSSFNEKFTQRHPFPDERLIKIMEGFIKHSNIEKNNNAWTMATWVLMTWDFLTNRLFPGSGQSIFRFDDIKDNDISSVFYKTVGRLQNKKIWTSK